MFHFGKQYGLGIYEQIARLHKAACHKRGYKGLLFCLGNLFEELFPDHGTAEPDIHHAAVVGDQRIVFGGGHLGCNHQIDIDKSFHIKPHYFASQLPHDYS